VTPQSGNQVTTSLGNSGLCWTIFARNRDTAVPAEGNGDLQTLICVLVARPRRFLTLSNPVLWQNWMAAYLGYTLWMKTLFCGWPVMAHETHMRRRRLPMTLRSFQLKKNLSRASGKIYQLWNWYSDHKSCELLSCRCRALKITIDCVLCTTACLKIITFTHLSLWLFRVTMYRFLDKHRSVYLMMMMMMMMMTMISDDDDELAVWMCVNDLPVCSW